MEHDLTPRLTADLAVKFAGIALGHVTQQYPHKLDHVLNGPEDAQTPKALHPIFYGSFDWHSCVHGYWMLLTLRRLHPEESFAADVEKLADTMLTEDKVAVELAYLEREYSGGFERPYGWAWLLALHREAALHTDRDWVANLEPLAREFGERLKLFLPKQGYPIRTGTHYNTAFALVLAHGWAEENDPDLLGLIHERAGFYYGMDRDCQAWEPGGDEFLSSAMIEALCMRTVLGKADFGEWFAAFLPRLDIGQPTSLFTPAAPSDRSDGKIAHLDGCNLSRAWCWRSIADALPAEGAAQAHELAERHLAVSLPHVEGDYMGEHWLASFAVLALMA
ncbi:DUF2891 domain-containing protein [Parasphingopyxis lamellibrachiae]|uniref:DUF2891 family protein n=1 Tax=Parasphingopyxis lamellibrachiae TaxID=680125 RepID=A0A3D9FDA3_9SPHN|nr:DUF2891 domain-containing protein [Parasphingopyxis lamellibrachiae]RED15759.1 hypothetical protein DFR46_0765 [Parasphingopyxis lamellibrachiae]